jgi:hypothetical protein
MAAHVQIHVSSPGNKLKPKKRYRARYRRLRDGHRLAALRAVTAAHGYLNGQFSSLATAALYCGSCRAYVRAATVLLRAENLVMVEQVSRGQMPLLAAARQLKQIANLVNAYRTAGAADRVAFAKTIGPTTLFDSALVPAL